MDAKTRADAVRQLQRHLDQFDWHTQSPSRQQALAAFLRLANVHGFAAVTMRMLAAELNLKAPSLYAHFPDGKDEIVAESLRWHFAKFGAAVLDAVAPTRTPEQFWDALVRTHLTRQIELPESNLWDLLIATDQMVHFLPPAVRVDVDDLVTHYEDMYRAAAVDMGAPVAEDLIALVMTILEGATRWCAADGLDAGLERAVQVSHVLLQLPSPGPGAGSAAAAREAATA